MPRIPVCYNTTTGVTIAGATQSITTPLNAVALRLGPNVAAGAISSLNGLTAGTQLFAVGSAGTDFAVVSATATHTFNLPTASAANRGALSAANWSTFNAKESALTFNSRS